MSASTPTPQQQLRALRGQIQEWKRERTSARATVRQLPLGAARQQYQTFIATVTRKIILAERQAAVLATEIAGS